MSDHFTRTDTCATCGADFTVTFEITDDGVRAISVPEEATAHAVSCLATQAETAKAAAAAEMAVVQADPEAPVAVEPTSADRIAELERRLEHMADVEARIERLLSVLEP